MFIRTIDDQPLTFGDALKARHVYAVEVTARGECVKVYAHNRDHAARIAERAGYVVRSVNMEG